MANVAVVVVTFQPDLAQLERTLVALAASGPELIVFDNSVAPGAASRVRAVCEAAGVRYLGGRGNIGIAAAQNEAVASVSASDRVVFLDQDSRVGTEFLASLHASFERLLAIDGHAGILGATPVDERGTPYAVPVLSTLEEYRRVEWVISSGSIMRLEDLRAAGGLRADLFIDLVDCELCWRLRRRGFSCYADPRLRFEHPIGQGGARRVLGRTMVISSPSRAYYQVRNAILLGRDGTLSVLGSARRVLMLLGSVILAGLIAGAPWSRAVHAARGLRDGLLGRGGPLR